LRVNRDTQIRPARRPVVLGKGDAKVMSCEDLEEKRAAKDRAAEEKSKGICSCKRKAATQEDTAHAALSMLNDKVARRSEKQECAPFRAPKAKMY
jgi:hypothetical protein